MSDTSFKVIVIGGGIGGLCLAQGLKRAGAEVAVYERDRTKTDRLEGYRIHIDPDGAKALHSCLPTTTWDAFVASTVDLGAFRFLTEGLHELMVLESDSQVAPESGPAERSHAIDRVTLREVLLTDLDDVLHFNKKFERYERGPGGMITAHFADGTTATGHVLVGADGVNSQLRKQYLPQVERVDTDAFGIGLKLPLTEEVRDWLEPPLSTGRNMIMAPAPYFLSISVFDRTTEFDRTTDHDGLPSTPGDNAYVGTAFVVRRSACPANIHALNGTELKKFIERLISGWHPQLRRLVAESDPDSALLVPYQTSVPVKPWESTNITLLGDAVHSMSPVGGLGGNTALRDADLLCRNLVRVHGSGTPAVEAIRDYETTMLEYGFAAVRKALRYQKQGLQSNKLAVSLSRMSFRAINSMMQRRSKQAARRTDPLSKARSAG
ncbi:NAD(P)/FAD-dependent oxidoreductase [Saccharopolyspora sp. ASAGF58]|uniref:FAD-dependent oxidoreductase n=1 Tax=Saccharopolyspora sp. ASAGF58 TaxID=2719023 RepID=UPI00144699A3|nr:NAD(P)/FAD-dependent oxidoreductase [Saccharopolyspora sp. ASAGF58]